MALGFTSRMIEGRLAHGQLHVLERGVYAVGHLALSRRGHWMAAVLAAGPDAVLSHRSAGVLWSVVRYDGPIEITVPGKGRGRRGTRTHSSRLASDERTVVDGIPVTTAARTLLDLAAVLPATRLARAVNEAEVLRLSDVVSLPELLLRHPRRRGSAALKALTTATPAVLRSELEHAFLAFAERFDLPRPVVNGTRSGYELDALWPDARVVVELDGRAFHATRQAFERDRAQDRRLVVEGWRVIRITWRQLHADRAGLADDLHRLMGTAPPPVAPPGA